MRTAGMKERLLTVASWWIATCLVLGTGVQTRGRLWTCNTDMETP